MKWMAESMPDLTDRIFIVTGANSGIGFEASLALAKKGAEVVLACRSASKARGAVDRIKTVCVNSRLHSLSLDLASLNSIHRFADEFYLRFDRLDVLINNAGVMSRPTREVTVDGFEKHIGINHLGHFALTGYLIDVLSGTSGSRVVTVSGGLHRAGKIRLDDLHWEKRRYGRMRAYSQSKLANLLFSFELARRFAEGRVETTSVAAHPGWTATALQRHVNAPLWLKWLYAMNPAQGVLPILYAATASEARNGGYYGPDGIFELKGYPTPVSCSIAAKDEKMAQKLWDCSVESTQVELDLASRVGL